MGQYITNLGQELKPVSGGFTAVTVSTSVVTPSSSITPAASATHVQIQNLTSGIRERSDGTNPGATSGFLYAAGGAPRIVTVQEFARLKWIRDTGAGSDAVVNVQTLAP